MQERVMKLDTAAQELHRKLGRSPSPKELAGELELTEEEILEAMEAASAYDAVSLEQQRGDTDNGSSDTFQDTLGTEEERYELVEYGATIAPTLKALSARERLILHLRFVEDMTQSEIADRIGISQMHVSRLIRKALQTMRDEAVPD
jgi:RNA polymerase sigma-B factor